MVDVYVTCACSLRVSSAWLLVAQSHSCLVTIQRVNYYINYLSSHIPEIKMRCILQISSLMVRAQHTPHSRRMFSNSVQLAATTAARRSDAQHSKSKAAQTPKNAEHAIKQGWSEDLASDSEAVRV